MRPRHLRGAAAPFADTSRERGTQLEQPIRERLDQLPTREPRAPFRRDPLLAVERARELAVDGTRRVGVVAEIDGEERAVTVSSVHSPTMSSIGLMASRRNAGGQGVHFLTTPVSACLLGQIVRGTLRDVTKGAAKLLEEALKLDSAGRAELAAELIASLDGGADEGVEAAWAAEIEERATRARSGADPGEAWSEVRAHLERDLRSR